jgi:hypothetical protein
MVRLLRLLAVAVAVVAIAGCVLLLAQPAPAEARIACVDCTALGATVPVYVTTNEFAGVACRLPNDADVRVIAKRDGFLRVKGIACAGWVQRERVQFGEAP